MPGVEGTLDEVLVILTILDFELYSTLEVVAIRELKRRRKMGDLGHLGDLLDDVFMFRYEELRCQQRIEVDDSEDLELSVVNSTGALARSRQVND